MSFEARHRGFVDEAGLFSPDELERNPPLAATADIMKIYEEAVQEPLIEVTNLDSLYSQVQPEDTDRYDARILREDFCSTAIVANSWLTLDPKNEAQGVDIDLDALQDTQRRYGSQNVRILQSPAFGGGKGTTTELTPPKDSQVQASTSQNDPSTNVAAPSIVEENGQASTWAPGAASDRFERRFLARQTRERAKRAKVEVSAKKGTETEQAPRLTLLHSDVLHLPLPPVSGQKVETGKTDSIPPPDLVATLNYGLCYFHDRATLVRYLSMCARTLRPKTGVLICDQWGGPATGESYPADQEGLWAKFEKEVGFKRKRASPSGSGSASKSSLDHVESALLRDDGTDSKGLLAVYPAPSDEARGTPAEWPRGKLKMVRKGKQHGGFEYWREDGPIDYMTNRFRMGLSFRFSDGSWIRDFFSYDFRIWSLKEISEAMLEAGFARVSIHVLPRNIHDDEDKLSDVHMSSRPTSPEYGPASGDEPGDPGLEHMSHLLRQTEKEERERADYRQVGENEKVFATRSFSTYIMANVD
ncbi:unnamed protein product [Tilletia controversa]|uniref:Uncharacterized protein n=3 Tax=Tilletia TaxID=13289 RepID=A0A8X7MT85_9BASI|nr:hypothetical protein CF328_g3775 [Tilletia controversa]KAE8208061.1 hypothetical protein CF335_g692 [Tilletia laevis]KAE8262805.1 hypothetical protein A4X03_0g2163 [Tilletia caries]KAE8247707.1 hypothetical protein A4X06_0g4251 [Tilletia controversa]CAD6893212.1 unnamed protein product [Tilletia caries]